MSATLTEELVIGGERLPAAEGRTFEVLNPASAGPLATVAEAGVEDVNRAVAAAAAAYETWGALSPVTRGRTMHRFANVVADYPPPSDYRFGPDGYAQHMTDAPYPNTPRHEVMLHVALGDHQVAPVSADVEARTIGARLLRRPAEEAGRNADVEPHYGIRTIEQFPGKDSTLVIWDSGEPIPPTTNTSPTEGQDPHEFPRRTKAARAMKSAFLSIDSRVLDTCNGAPCRTDSYTPPSG